MPIDASNIQGLWSFAAIMCGAFLLCLCALIACIALLQRERRNQRRNVSESLDRSRSVLRGQVAETFAPLLPGFPFNLKDARFIGQPVDYLVFDGLTEHPDNQHVEIVFVEFKTGNSGLSQREAVIRQAVREGRVRWMTLRMDTQGRISEEF